MAARPGTTCWRCTTTLLPTPGQNAAWTYAGRVERACLGLAEFPARGAPRDDIRPGVRVLAFQRRVLIAYTVTGAEVRILRILYGGRQFGDDDPT